MNKSSKLFRAAALLLACLFVCLCMTGCAGKLKKSDSPDAQNSSESVSETSSEAETTVFTPDENYYENDEGTKFTAEWRDKYSGGRCNMIISHIGGNYYDISIRWKTSELSSICWSLLGTYNAGTDKMDYTGMEYEIFLTDEGVPSAEVISNECSGNFFFNDDEVLKWSDREKCKFLYEDDPYESKDFAVISSASADGLAYVMTDTEEGEIAGALPDGVMVNVEENDGTYAEIACGEIKGYVQSTQLTEPSIKYEKPAVKLMWKEDLDNAGAPEFSASDSYYASDIAIIPTETLKDFRILSLEYTESDNGEGFDIAKEEIYSLDTLDRTLIVTLLFRGSLPNNGISYTDANGLSHTYAVSESGRDGSLILSSID